MSPPAPPVRGQDDTSFRASFEDVHGRLAADADVISIEGSAPVQSISIKAPPALRDQVIRDCFLGDNHPEVIFRATEVELGDDDTAKVTGELTMRGVACSITAVWAQAELRKVLKTIGADVLDAELPVPTAHAAFCNGGGLCDPELAATLRSNMHRLVGQTLRQAA